MPEKTVLQILKEGRELISDPERWTQGTAARGIKGEPVLIHDKSAVCWCSWGSIQFMVDFPDVGILARAERRLKDASECRQGYIVFNDTHSHAEVLAMWDKAISAEEKAAETDGAAADTAPAAGRPMDTGRAGK